jgi:hypothetical protein
MVPVIYAIFVMDLKLVRWTREQDADHAAIEVAHGAHGTLRVADLG